MSLSWSKSIVAIAAVFALSTIADAAARKGSGPRQGGGASNFKAQPIKPPPQQQFKMQKLQPLNPQTPKRGPCRLPKERRATRHQDAHAPISTASAWVDAGAAPVLLEKAAPLTAWTSSLNAWRRLCRGDLGTERRYCRQARLRRLNGMPTSTIRSAFNPTIGERPFVPAHRRPWCQALRV
jgi:hypothetical protein